MNWICICRIFCDSVAIESLRMTDPKHALVLHACVIGVGTVVVVMAVAYGCR